MSIAWFALLREARQRAGLTQQELASRAGTSQPAVARIEAAAVSPTLDTLTRLVLATGFQLELRLAPAPAADPVVDAYKRDVDRTLLRQNIARTVDERLRGLASLQRSAAELGRAGARSRKGR